MASNVNIVTTPAVTSVAASCLTYVSGDINIDGNSYKNYTLGMGSNLRLLYIAFPLLTYTPGYFQIWNSGGGKYNVALVLVNLKTLAYVGLYFFIAANKNAGFSLHLAKLTYVGQYFTIQNNWLTELSLPSLAFVGAYVDIDGNILLTLLSLPVLTYIGQYLLVETNGPGNEFNINTPVTILAPALVSIANIGNLIGFSVFFCNSPSNTAYSATITQAAHGSRCYLNCLATVCN